MTLGIAVPAVTITETRALGTTEVVVATVGPGSSVTIERVTILASAVNPHALTAVCDPMTNVLAIMAATTEWHSVCWWA